MDQAAAAYCFQPFHVPFAFEVGCFAAALLLLPPGAAPPAHPHEVLQWLWVCRGLHSRVAQEIVGQAPSLNS